MGQKVNPTGFRLGTTFSWKSQWYAHQDNYSDRVLEDYRLREYLQDKIAHAGLVDVLIKRSLKKITIEILVSRPGVVIGRGGSNLKEIRAEVENILNLAKTKQEKVQIDIQVKEVEKPNLVPNWSLKEFHSN